jgi:hypothetical protein
MYPYSEIQTTILLFRPVKEWLDDPYNYHGNLRINWANQILKAVRENYNKLAEITTPLLILQGYAANASAPIGEIFLVGVFPVSMQQWREPSTGKRFSAPPPPLILVQWTSLYASAPNGDHSSRLVFFKARGCSSVMKALCASQDVGRRCDPTRGGPPVQQGADER